MTKPHTSNPKPQADLVKDFYRVDEVAERWNVSTRTIYRLINWGELPVYRIAGSYRIKPEDILDYEKSHQEDPLT